MQLIKASRVERLPYMKPDLGSLQISLSMHSAGLFFNFVDGRMLVDAQVRLSRRVE